ncbi:hypothetical protein [Embleya sp. AB8]|uniref:hypothetical protein n=1 Tax=Embleya sp. AB8 TaxID=3156304 RepID=UPI003C7643C8
MTRESLELTLYEVSCDRSVRERFAADPDALRARYRLTDHEASLLRDRDVRGLLQLGVNPMLVWGFWLTTGGRPGEYLARLRDAEAR